MGTSTKIALCILAHMHTWQVLGTLLGMDAQNLHDTLNAWRRQDVPAALATVVKVYGSAPRPLGAQMAVSAAGEMAGSVSGGCVEGAVAQEALEVLATGRPRLVEYGISDDWAKDVGLACGGNIQVFIRPAPPVVARRATPVLHVTVLDGPEIGAWLTYADGAVEASTVTDAALANALVAQADGWLAMQQTRRTHIAHADATVDLLVEVLTPPAQLIIVGAVHTAIALVHFAKPLGFHTVVVDARDAFATPARFSHADELITGWPADVLAARELTASTYVVFLSHDEKIDNPALLHALHSPARYIGALGARRTHAARVDALRELGATDAQLARIHAPVGLDIGARTPEEIALAIMAEIVAVKNGVAEKV